MNVPSKTDIADAIRRLPGQSSADIKRVRDHARKADLKEVVDACDAELQARPFEFDANQARSFAEMAGQVREMGLAEAIRYAFTTVRPADHNEVRFVRWLFKNPNGSYQQAMKHHGKQDLSLVVGHLVYHRYGCFQKFIREGFAQSDILIERSRSAEGVRYRLRPEAEKVFRDIGLT